MPEPDDELTALRAADPVDRASLPSATDPEARALFERITMTDTAASPVEADASPVRSRRPLVAVAAAVVLIAVVGGGVALTRDDGIDRPSTDDAASDPITPGGSSLGSCVEFYDLTTLAKREMAFDGTVASVAGDTVTFTVSRWYRGGDAQEVVLHGAEGLSGLDSAGPGATLTPGARLLVAGDGGFAWSCGFTQAYDPTVAQQWEDVFAG